MIPIRSLPITSRFLSRRKRYSNDDWIDQRYVRGIAGLQDVTIDRHDEGRDKPAADALARGLTKKLL